jgi:hypothetical protein
MLSVDPNFGSFYTFFGAGERTEENIASESRNSNIYDWKMLFKPITAAALCRAVISNWHSEGQRRATMSVEKLSTSQQTSSSAR